jgi:rare lipoprotein A
MCEARGKAGQLERIVLARVPGVVLLLALGVGGCHKKTDQAYRPPPPPAADEGSARGSNRASSAASNRTGPGGPDVRSPQLSPDAARGKPSLTEVGLASWYGPPYAGRRGADGSVYDQNAMTAAHLTLPLGTLVRVTNLANDETVLVRITDRGPFVRGRIIDLSLAAAKATGIYRMGVAKVRLEAYTPPPRPNSIPGGRWCVQIGAFYNPEDAIQLKNDLARRYSTAKVIEFQGPTGYWVRINPAQPDRAHAEGIVDSIHVPDAEPYLTRTD